MSKQEIWELFYGADTAIRGRNILAVLVAALIIGFVIFYYLPGNTPEYGIFR